MRFALRVVTAFLGNRGVLLAGGVGYNILLSIIPLFAVISVMLTHVVDEQYLLDIIAIQARHLAPGHAGVLIDAVRALLDTREKMGLIGILVLFLFSSFAFRMLEDALAIIFRRLDTPASRSFWVSAILPYGFMLVLGGALLGLTLVVSTIDAIDRLLELLFGTGLPLAGLSSGMLNLLSFLAMFMMFSAIYKILPVARISLRRAVAGGFVAALLWEGVRLLLVGYFANISFVNAVYGSLAAIVIVLLSLEIGAIILLLGAQVIAELEHNDRLGLPWHVDRYRQEITTL